MPDALSRPALILVDGHALAYRQFFALPVEKFTTQDGEPTNATFGFARTLLDLLDMKPDYLAVSFDLGLGGRELLYPAYKGTRDKMSDILFRQMDRIREVVQAFNVPILEREGCEADDVIGTAARQAEEKGVNVYVLTGDHDLLQLVNGLTRVWLPPSKIQTNLQLYDKERVIAEKGVAPEQIPDLKALMGDTSDNIPGVAGVGEKTAASLLQQYGTLNGVYEHVAEQKPGLRTKLETGRESAFLSKNLATIRINVPIALDLQKCVAHDYDSRVVAALFKKLEFRSLIPRLPEAAATSGTGQQLTMFAATDAPVAQVAETIVVDTTEALAGLVADLEKAEAIAFDTETTGLKPIHDKLVGISLSTDGQRAYYIPVGHVTPDGLFGTPPRQLPLSDVINAIT